MKIVLIYIGRNTVFIIWEVVILLYWRLDHYLDYFIHSELWWTAECLENSDQGGKGPKSQAS